MQTVELTVELKIPDVTALTAASALRRRLGYGDVLMELHRADYYRLSLAADSEQQALELAEELAENTNLFVNPNKHRYQVAAGVHNAATVAGDGVWTVKVLVSAPESGAGEAILSALQGRLGYRDQVSAVVAGDLWTLVLQADSKEQAEAIAQEIAVTESRGEGLLLNPHYQEYEMW